MRTQDTLTKLKTIEESIRPASFDQLGLLSDPHINFQKSRNLFIDPKGPENITYTIVKYGETFTAATCPVSILYKSIAGRYRPVSYPDGPITAHYRYKEY